MICSLGLIGAGNRGKKYLKWVAENPSEASVCAIVEPDDNRRRDCAALAGLPASHCFRSADELFASDLKLDGVIIAAPDQLHYPLTMAAIEKGWHVLLEKPAATTREHCQAIAEAAAARGVYVSVCFVLRHHPYWQKFRDLIKEESGGRILSVHHEINAGIDRYVHTFVRGLWSREEDSCPLLLSKCSHDVDLLLYLTGGTPVKQASFGQLSLFRRENAPEGSTERCIDCPMEEKCPFSAVDLYRRRGEWNLNFDIARGETLDDAVARELATGRYGRCAYRCNNNVVDHQTLLVQLADGATMSLRLNCLTQQDNRITVVNTAACEIRGDGSSIELRRFASRGGATDGSEPIRFDFSKEAEAPFHAGADFDIVSDFVGRIRNGNFAGSETDIATVLPSHLVCFDAEDFRKSSL